MSLIKKYRMAQKKKIYSIYSILNGQAVSHKRMQITQDAPNEVSCFDDYITVFWGLYNCVK